MSKIWVSEDDIGHFYVGMFDKKCGIFQKCDHDKN